MSPQEAAAKKADAEPKPAAEEAKAEAKPAVAVSPKLVKELRDKSGAGMMDCKKALAGGKLLPWLGTCLMHRVSFSPQRHLPSILLLTGSLG